MKSECENLDAFVAGELDAVAAAGFDDHLRECSVCRDTIEQERWLNSLLRSPERLELETPPGGILESFRTGVARRREHSLRRLRLSGGRGGDDCRRLDEAKPPSGWAAGPEFGETFQAAGLTPPVSEPHATFVGGPDVIVVPIAFKSPNVTVVRIYPTYQTTFVEPVSDEVDSTDIDLARPDDFNGG